MSARLRVLAWHARPAVGVVGLLIACAVAARIAAPPPPPTVPMVVTAREVVAGAELAASDLRVAAVPRPLVPAGSATVDAVTTPDLLAGLIGRRAAVDLPRGLAVVETLLEGERFGVQPPAGAVVVPVRLDAAVVRLLRPGDRVDLVAAQDPGWDDTGLGSSDLASAGLGPAVLDDPDGDGGSTAATGTQPPVLARRALVLDVGGRPDDERGDRTGLTGIAPTPEGDPVALVAVTPEEGRSLAAAAAQEVLGAVLVQ